MKAVFILVVICIPQFCLAQQSKTHFSSLDVFELEWVSDPQISPDGSKIVYSRRGMDIMNDRKTSSLWFVDANGNNHRKLTQSEKNERSARWSPDGKSIVFVSSTDQGAEIFTYWIESGQYARLTQLNRSPSNITWSKDGTSIAFTMLVPEKAPYLAKAPKQPKGAKWANAPRVTTRFNHESDGAGYIEQGYHHVFVLPSDGGTPRQITSGNYNHRSSLEWVDSKILFSAIRDDNWEYIRRNTEIYSVDVINGSIDQLTDRNGPDRGATISHNGQKVAYLGYGDKVQTYQINKLYIMNLDGSGKREIVTNLDRNISSLKWDSKGTGIYFKYDDKGNTKIGHTNLSGKTSMVAENVGGDVIGRPYGGGSYSISDNDKIAYNFCSGLHPADLAIVEKGKSKKRITNLNSDILDYRKLGVVEEVWYTSSFDKRQIQGWLVKPPNFDSSKKYPLLVENHGGPVANYGGRFSPEMQLYAAAGYVVFYPNPRGSTSYGEEFGNLLYNNYPGQDYDDVMSGVDYVIEKDLVSEDSLFVTGGSAGGIMTSWMIGKNNRFRSAAVVKPVMNWISKTLVADNYYGYAEYRYPGKPWENMENYWKFSPLSLVGNIQTPTLVMVGMKDLRTPVSEAKQLYHALKWRKIETVFVEIPGSYHNISNRPGQLITKVAHILAWFEKYR